MATITEDYVSFETAKLLNEKGFNEPTWTRYENDDDNEVIFGDKYNWNNSPMRQISAPTLQMAMKFLREEHELHIMVDCVGRCNYNPIIQRFDGEDFEVDGVVRCITKQIGKRYVNVCRGFKTYEEAAEAAIKYCLENLI